jgi:hypothetical protein
MHSSRSARLFHVSNHIAGTLNTPRLNAPSLLSYMRSYLKSHYMLYGTIGSLGDEKFRVSKVVPE